MKTNEFYKILLIVLIIGITLGLFIPVQTPLDNYTEEQEIKKVSKINVPVQKKYLQVKETDSPIQELFIDLNNDGEPEWYFFAPIERKCE